MESQTQVNNLKVTPEERNVRPLKEALNEKRCKSINVFYDTETYKYNGVSDDPKNYKVTEYIVSVKFKMNDTIYAGVVPNLYCLIEYLRSLKCTVYALTAHNSRGYDAHLLEKSIKMHYNLLPRNSFVRGSKMNKYASKVKDLDGDYLVEKRINGAKNLDFTFRLGYKVFHTDDTFPKCRMSVKVLGHTLTDYGCALSNDLTKLQYEKYTEFDVSYDMSNKRAEQHAYDIFNSLSKEDKNYCMHDTNIIFAFWYHYYDIYPSSYSYDAPTVTSNIINEYAQNKLCAFQLKGIYPFGKKFQLSYRNYKFAGYNLESYFRHGYKGGMNLYNPNYVGKKLIGRNIVHIDLNSSYPTVMYYEMFPCGVKQYSEEPVKLDPKDLYTKDHFYYIEMNKVAFERNILKYIRRKTKIGAAMVVKRLRNLGETVFFGSGELQVFEGFAEKSFTNLPVESFIEFNCLPFGGLDLLSKYYAKKVVYKKLHLPSSLVASAKQSINSVYGATALRSFFSQDVVNTDGTILKHDSQGFENAQRNIMFAVTITSYAFRNLIKPLFSNVKGIDKNFIYCDTDSIFMYEDYWETIKKDVILHPYNLGAWDMEHKDIAKMYVLNHKKYIIESKSKGVEIFCGGIPKDTFETERGFDYVVAAQFHNGATITMKKSTVTREGTIAIFDQPVEMSVGKPYDIYIAKRPSQVVKDNLHMVCDLFWIAMKEEKERSKGETANHAMYYESSFASYSVDSYLDKDLPTDKCIDFISYAKLANLAYIRFSVDAPDLIKKQEKGIDYEKHEAELRKELGL